MPRCTDHNVDGRNDIPQMEADYPAVTTGKTIDGGETRARDLRDEEKGFPQIAHLFCGKRLRCNGLCTMRSEPRERRCNNLERSDIECRNDANDATWRISEVCAT